MQFSTPPLETKKGMVEAEKVEKPQKTFFFERENGKVFCTSEREAWAIISGKNQVVGQKMVIPKLIGTSDGTITYQATIEARNIFQKEGLDKAQEYIRMAQDLELEESKKHITQPRNFDTLDNYGRPVKISDLR